jgi:hypothetical protein
MTKPSYSELVTDWRRHVAVIPTLTYIFKCQNRTKNKNKNKKTNKQDPSTGIAGNPPFVNLFCEAVHKL